MKNRDEFIQSVWEKAEAAQAAETVRRKQRRRIYSFTAAAACLILVIGVTAPGSLQEASDHAFEPEGEYNITSTITDSVTNNNYVAGTEDKSARPADDGSDQDMAMPGMSMDGALSSGNLDDYQLYDELRRQTETAAEAKRGDTQDMSAYYFLPAGIEIQSGGSDDGTAMYTADENEVLKYMQWFYSLPEDQVLTTEEFEELDVIPTGYYKFTMDCSLGADTEGVDRVFWITGEVTLP